MKILDTRISEALRAQAEQLTEQNLTPMQPPSGHRPRSNWTVPLLVAAAVVVLTAGGTVAIRTATEPSHRPQPPAGSHPAPSGTAPAPTSSGPAPTASGPSEQPTPTQSATGQPNPTPAPVSLPAGYEPLWPLDAAGHGRPAGDAGSTALAFTVEYLGFTEITNVTSTRYDNQGAHIGVGFHNPNGQVVTAAVLHLVQFSGSGAWEVVGSADTDLTLEQPRYGSRVTSPMNVGGHITGVDENVVVRIYSLGHGLVGAAAGVPAGGEATPWGSHAYFTGSGPLTIVAFTGGHLQEVERFAIQGVHT
jgi:hypothetical protein